METLPALRHCAAILAKREADDPERRWQWEIRLKVLRWSIATLERQADAAAKPDELSLTERQTLEATHPLLRPPGSIGVPAYQPDSGWRQAICGRVQKYLDSLKRRH